MASAHRVEEPGGASDQEASALQRYEWLVLLLVFLVGCVILALRRPDAVANPQFYVEDGTTFYADAHEMGALRALVTTHRGYFCLAQRLGAALAIVVPFSFAPLVSNLVGMALQALPAVFLASSRLLPERPVWVRLGMALLYLVMPATWGTNANLTHSMWHLASLGCMVVVARPARTTGWRIFDVAALAVAGLTGPFSILLTPVAALKWFATRSSRDLGVAAAVAAMGAIQATSLLLTPARPEGAIPIGPSLSSFTRIVAQRVVYGALFGQHGAEKIMSSGSNPLDWKVGVAVAAVLGVAAMLYAAWRGPLELRLYILFAGLTFAAALATPAPSAPAIWWELLRHPGNGNRYFVTTVFALLMTLVWFASQRRAALRAVGIAGVAVAVLFGVRYDRREPPYPDFDFEESVWRYENAADRERLILLEPPVDWELAITKRGGRDPESVRECPREVRVDATLLGAHDVALQDGVANATGGDPYVVYRIPDRGRVCGVRITYELVTPQFQNAVLQLFWAREGVSTFVANERNTTVRVPATGARQTTTFHVDDRIDEIRIDPHTMGTRFKLIDVVLILGPEGT
jgi:hypothetical protein